mgnify:CR=1 FL=1
MLIFKLFRKDEWLKFKASGKTDGAPIDVSDGFIHFSTSEQVKETAKLHFNGVKNLLLIKVNTEKLEIKDDKYEMLRINYDTSRNKNFEFR